MAGYGQFCPVARGAELFAERWTPLILRELMKGNYRFSELMHGLPRISRNLLVQRLAEFERAGLIEIQPVATGRGHEYRLTEAGRELGPVVDALGRWAYKWVSRELRPENLDPGLLMWFLRRRVCTENLPEERVVVRFAFRGVKHRFWLVLERPEVDLCFTDPGFDVDLDVTADLETLTRVYLGHVPLAAALRAHAVEVVGPSVYRRRFPSWIGITPFAQAARRVAHAA
jgi:DNA-binding HxlR family transcriptional regulator